MSLYSFLGILALASLWVNSILVMIDSLSGGWKSFLFVLPSLFLLIGITFLIFVPPYMGSISTLGAFLGLIYFMLIQPAGVWFKKTISNDQSFPHESSH